MNVKELTEELSKYNPEDEIASINSVRYNMLNQVILYHKNTPEEDAALEMIEERRQKDYEEMMDRRGEITSFANRW